MFGTLNGQIPLIFIPSLSYTFCRIMSCHAYRIVSTSHQATHVMQFHACVMTYHAAVTLASRNTSCHDNEMT